LEGKGAVRNNFAKNPKGRRSNGRKVGFGKEVRILQGRGKACGTKKSGYGRTHAKESMSSPEICEGGEKARRKGGEKRTIKYQ